LAKTTFFAGNITNGRDHHDQGHGYSAWKDGNHISATRSRRIEKPNPVFYLTSANLDKPIRKVYISPVSVT